MLALSEHNAETFDRAVYDRDGIQILKRYLDDRSKAVLGEIYERFRALLAAGKITRTSVHTSGDHGELFDAIDRIPAIRGLAQSIVGENYCRLLARFLIKDASCNGLVPAHQDYPYFGGYPEKLNIFVPITDANQANGTLTFLKGSHRYGPLERGEIDLAKYPHLERLSLNVEVGDIAIADFLTWHYSTPATIEAERVIVQVAYQPSTDPSSKVLIAGRILNPVHCPNRETPLKTRETQVSYVEATTLFKHRYYEDAAQTCLSVLANIPSMFRFCCC